MNPIRPDAPRVREHVQSALFGEAVRIDNLIDQAVRLSEWTALPLPPDIQEHLRGDLQRVSTELCEALVLWKRRGGQFAVQPPPMIEESAPASLPTPSIVQVVPPVPLPTVHAVPPVVQVVPPVATIVAAPSGPPMTTDALSKLAAHFKAGPAFNPEPPAGWGDDLLWVVTTLGSPHEEDEPEIDRLQKVLDRIDKWKGFPRLIQRDLVGLCTCRLRRLQDERGVGTARLDEAFSALSGWSRKEQPGYVNGLSRGHTPTRGSWTDDAEAYMSRLQAPVAAIPKPNQEKLVAAVEAVLPELKDAPSPEVFEAVRASLRRAIRAALDGGVSARDPRLVRLVSPYVAELDGVEYRNLRRAVREETEEPEVEDEEEKAVAIPNDWGWWGRTRGRRGILVGGDPREPNRLRLEQTFGFSSLDWEPAEHRRNSLIAVRDRVRAGKVDIVIILGAFVGHDADEIILPACRETGVDWVHLDKGYGVVRMRRAIERFLDPLKG